MNQLRKAVRDYLTMRRGLGFKLAKHEGGLQEFVSFLARKRSSRITVNLALEWATLNPNHKPYDWAARLSIVPRLRPALECHGFLDRSSAARPAALPATARSAILLLRSGNPGTAESC